MNFYINFTQVQRADNFGAIATPLSMQLGYTKLM